jgi:hypothetical protein
MVVMLLLVMGQQFGRRPKQLAIVGHGRLATGSTGWLLLLLLVLTTEMNRNLQVNQLGIG